MLNVSYPHKECLFKFSKKEKNEYFAEQHLITKLVWPHSAKRSNHIAGRLYRIYPAESPGTILRTDAKRSLQVCTEFRNRSRLWIFIWETSNSKNILSLKKKILPESPKVQIPDAAYKLLLMFKNNLKSRCGPTPERQQFSMALSAPISSLQERALYCLCSHLSMASLQYSQSSEVSQ